MLFIILQAQHIEIQNDRAALEEQNRQAAILQQQLTAQRLEIEQARAQLPLQQPIQNQHQQGENQQANGHGNITADLSTILGNINTLQLEIKVPDFCEENMCNPLEFLDNVEKFFKFKSIENSKKLSFVNTFLKRRARAWFELQDSFKSYEKFNSTLVQVKLKKSMD